MLIAQITDLHVVAEGTLALGAVDTNACLAEAVARLNTLSPRPDVVVVTGDLVNDGRPEEYDALGPLLSRLEIPMLAVPGNHDDRDGMRAVFAGADWLPADGGPIRFAVDCGPLRLIGLDTLVPGAVHGEVGCEQLAWLERALAGRGTRPTVVMMHHPPFRTGLEVADAIGCLDGAEVQQAMAPFPGVQRVLCGHLHAHIVAPFASTIAMTAPGAAHQFAIDLAGAGPIAWTREPPAIALHRWTGTAMVSHLPPVAAPVTGSLGG